MAVNVVMVAQAGRVAFEAALAVATWVPAPGFRLWIAEPAPGPLWPEDPQVAGELRDWLVDRSDRMVTFESRHFGATYPHGNKIEALGALPEAEPFVFFDSDTVFLRGMDGVAFDFDRPTASLRRGPSWPKVLPEGPTRAEIWRDLYARFGLKPLTDPTVPPDRWDHWAYFNAGWVFGPCPRRFGEAWARYATAIRDAPEEVLEGQSLDPWLDQVALPLAIRATGGDVRRIDGLDGDVTCHWRTLPLAYAREPQAVIDRIEAAAARPRLKKLLKRHPAFHRMLYRGGGAEVRALVGDSDVADEAVLRRRLRDAWLWMR
ncbi:hypothetical protein [Roseobacter sp. HKCCA0434]|uniref:hypothetical protein n=1 Tax=Roseobacter sp. HKCCA0434 TaxID=3079297 RepID=UPI0029059A09|nr:hypothetical protein [Roseobacter sp. HKCCA0434]